MTAILYMLGGAAIGAGAGIVLYLLADVLDLLSCICNIISCNFDAKSSNIAGGINFGSLVLWCAIGGAVIGLFIGIAKMKSAADAEKAKRDAENSEKAKKQRELWAGEMKKLAFSTKNACSKNLSDDSPLVVTEYKAAEQMEKINKAFTDLAEAQGLVSYYASEVESKGGGAK